MQQSPPRRNRGSLHAPLLAALGLVVCAGAFARAPAQQPSGELSPEEVVRCQMEALQGNGEGDLGIAVAFRFASPANRRVTGPLPRFVAMIKNGPYRAMLQSQLIEYGEVEVREDQASLQVSVLTRDFLAVAYRFYLSRQSVPGCEGCWMTDAVTVDDVRRVPGVDA